MAPRDLSHRRTPLEPSTKAFWSLHLEASGRKAALVVDSLENQHQVVVKSLSANFRRVAGVSGATILGNGRVSLILDVPGLLAMGQPKELAY